MTATQSIDILDLYRQLLESAGMVADDDGFISTQIAGSEKYPTLVKGKRLVLPTPAQLNNAAPNNCVVFHPLLENILRGESDVHYEFRSHMTKRLNAALAFLAHELLDLAVSNDKHARLSPDQSLYLSKVKNADAKTLEAFKNIMQKMITSDSNNAFVHTFLKKGGYLKNTRHPRVCVVSFPFYEKLAKEPEPRQAITVADVELRKVDRETLLGLFEFMLPDIAKPQAYWGGSNSTVAPNLDATVRAMALLATRINDLVALYHGQIEDIEEFGYDLDYLKIFDNLESLLSAIRLIPMQAGNEGNVPESGQSSPTAPALEAGHASVVQQTSVSPIGQVAPVVHQAAPSPAPQQIMQPSHPTYPAPVQTYQPQPVQQPVGYGYPAAPVQQPPAIVKTANGIDVNSLFQANPMLAAQAMAAMQPGMFPNSGMYPPQQMMQMPRQPSWAAPQAPMGMMAGQAYGSPPWMVGSGGI